MYEDPHLKVQIAKTSSLYKDPSIITATVVEVAAAVNSTTALNILVKATKPKNLGKGEGPNASLAMKKELCEQRNNFIKGGRGGKTREARTGLGGMVCPEAEYNSKQPDPSKVDSPAVISYQNLLIILLKLTFSLRLGIRFNGY